jgi:hypothetical protein
LRIFCWEVNDISSADKLYNILAKDPRVRNVTLLFPYEEQLFIEEGALKLMPKIHYMLGGFPVTAA